MTIAPEKNPNNKVANNLSKIFIRSSFCVLLICSDVYFDNAPITSIVIIRKYNTNIPKRKSGISIIIIHFV